MIEHEIIKVHQFCSNHKVALLKDKKCDCYYCLKIFKPNEIKEWIDDKQGTAVCPYCGIDSIIGESLGYRLQKIF